MAVSGGAANVIIKLQMTGLPQARAGFKAIEKVSAETGTKITREQEKSAKAQIATSRKLRRLLTREILRDANEQVRAHQKAEKDKTKATAREARERAKIDHQIAEGRRQAMRAREREAAREATRLSRMNQQALRNQERQSRQGRTMNERRFAAAGAGIGAVAGVGFQAAEHAQGVLGVRSQESITSDAIGLRQKMLAQVLAVGGSSADAEMMFNRSVQTAQARNVSPMQAIEAVVASQEQFSAVATALQGGAAGIEDFFRVLDANSLAARATGESVEDVSTAMGAFTRQFHLNAAQQQEAAGLIFQGAQDGSLSMGDFGNQFAQVIAPFITARGSSIDGMQGLREFQAIGQGLRAGDVAPELARTLTGGLLQNLSDIHVQERLAASAADGGLGISATDSRGNIRNIGDIVRDVAARGSSETTSTAFRSIFHSQEASQAMAILVNQERAGTTLRSRETTDAAVGNASMHRVALGMDADSSGRAMRMVVDREATALLQADQMIEVNMTLAERLTALQNEFPRLAMAFEALKPLMTAVIGVSAAKALLPGSFFSTLTGRVAPMAGTVFGAGAATSAAGGGAVASAVAPAATALGPLAVAAAAGATALGGLVMIMAAVDRRNRQAEEDDAASITDRMATRQLAEQQRLQTGSITGTTATAMNGQLHSDEWLSTRQRQVGTGSGPTLLGRSGFARSPVAAPPPPSAPASSTANGWQLGGTTPRQAAAPIVDETRAQTRAITSALSQGFAQVASAVGSRPATGSTSAVTPPAPLAIGPFR